MICTRSKPEPATEPETEKELELGIGIGIIAYGTEKQKSCAEMKCKRKPKNQSKGPADNLQSTILTPLCTEKQLRPHFYAPKI